MGSERGRLLRFAELSLAHILVIQRINTFAHSIIPTFIVISLPFERRLSMFSYCVALFVFGGAAGLCIGIGGIQRARILWSSSMPLKPNAIVVVTNRIVWQ
jgi:hypothetical protein